LLSRCSIIQASRDHEVRHAASDCDARAQRSVPGSPYQSRSSCARHHPANGAHFEPGLHTEPAAGKLLQTTRPSRCKGITGGSTSGARHAKSSDKAATRPGTHAADPFNYGSLHKHGSESDADAWHLSLPLPRSGCVRGKCCRRVEPFRCPAARGIHAPCIVLGAPTTLSISSVPYAKRASLAGAHVPIVTIVRLSSGAPSPVGSAIAARHAGRRSAISRALHSLTRRGSRTGRIISFTCDGARRCELLQNDSTFTFARPFAGDTPCFVIWKRSIAPRSTVSWS
jgi:hypothetical protein